MASKKILFVEQTELFESLEKAFYHREGFELIRATTGADVWEKVFHEKPDLVLMDSSMKGLNAQSCCRKIKNNPLTSQVPIIMLVPSGRDDLVRQSREAGCDDILQKPVSRHLFLEKAQKYLHLAGRAEPRVPARMEVFYGPQNQETLYNFSINLSLGGLFLESPSPLPEDTQLSLKFLLPDRENPVICNARVAWINDPRNPLNPSLPSGMGIQFLDVTLEDLMMIREYVKRHAADHKR